MVTTVMTAWYGAVRARPIVLIPRHERVSGRRRWFGFGRRFRIFNRPAGIFKRPARGSVNLAVVALEGFDGVAARQSNRRENFDGPFCNSRSFCKSRSGRIRVLHRPICRAFLIARRDTQRSGDVIL